jgi:putative transcriptional regulator
MKRTVKKTTPSQHDWSRLDAMTEAEKHAAALSDPDNRPLTEEDMKRMKRTPRAKVIRRALGLSQEDFAARYHIPIGTLRDWEQGRAEPDQAARALPDRHRPRPGSGAQGAEVPAPAAASVASGAKRNAGIDARPAR